MGNFNFVVIRDSAEESTVAIVSGHTIYGGMEDPLSIKEAVQVAVTRWLTDTIAGQQASGETKGDDFNVGDLALNLHDPILTALLLKEGISKFAIEIHTKEERGWIFDDALMLSAKEMEGK